jgi:hypothetical protein
MDGENQRLEPLGQRCTIRPPPAETGIHQNYRSGLLASRNQAEEIPLPETPRIQTIGIRLGIPSDQNTIFPVPGRRSVPDEHNPKSPCGINARSHDRGVFSNLLQRSLVVAQQDDFVHWDLQRIDKKTLPSFGVLSSPRNTRYSCIVLHTHN